MTIWVRHMGTYQRGYTAAGHAGGATGYHTRITFHQSNIFLSVSAPNLIFNSEGRDAPKIER